jgi:hypothetical protein
MTELSYPRMVFSLPISDEPGMHRGVLENEDRSLSLVKFRGAVARAMNGGLYEEESKFDYEAAAETAAMSMSNKPGISKMRGKQMSAAFLTLLVAVGAIKLEGASDEDAKTADS